VSGEMGLGGEESLPRTSGLGALRKPPKFKPNTCFELLDPTWTARLTWHLPKWCVLWQLTTVRKKMTVQDFIVVFNHPGSKFSKKKTRHFKIMKG
jgi:hypothetical protein